MIDLHDASTMADFCKDQLAQDIQSAMDEGGMNQSAFSAAIGTSRQYVSAMLRPSYNPTIKKLAEIASALKKKLVIRLVGETDALIPVTAEKIPQVRDFVFYDQPLETAEDQATIFTSLPHFKAMTLALTEFLEQYEKANGQIPMPNGFGGKINFH